MQLRRARHDGGFKQKTFARQVVGQTHRAADAIVRRRENSWHFEAERVITMKLFARLFRISRLRIASTLLTFAGLFLNLLLSMLDTFGGALHSPWTNVLPWIGVVSVFTGMTGFLISFERDIEVFTHTLQNYILPQHFAHLPVTRTQFAHAIRELVDFYTKQHQGGYLPVIEGLELMLSVDVLPSEEYSNYNIPLAPQGYTWQWFKFIIKSHWRLKPLSWGSQTVFDPQDFLDEILVMSYKIYVDLLGWRNPRRAVYLPVAGPVYEDEALRNALENIQYLKTTYTVRKYSNIGGVLKPQTHSIELQMENLFEREGKSSVLMRHFPGIERVLNINEISEGFYAFYKCKRRVLPSAAYIQLPQEENACWNFTSQEEYVLPVKVSRGTEVLWDQQAYSIPFHRVSTVKKLIFQTVDNHITFRQDRSPELFCYPNLTEPLGIKINLEGNKWIVESGSKFWYPGDVAVFLWHDTLIGHMVKGNE